MFKIVWSQTHYTKKLSSLFSFKSNMDNISFYAESSLNVILLNIWHLKSLKTREFCLLHDGSFNFLQLSLTQFRDFLFAFCFYKRKSFVNCLFDFGNGILLPKLFWHTVKKKVLVIEKNFWNLRLKVENLQNFWDHLNNLFKQWKVRTISCNRILFYLVPGGFSNLKN